MLLDWITERALGVCCHGNCLSSAIDVVLSRSLDDDSNDAGTCMNSVTVNNAQ